MSRLRVLLGRELSGLFLSPLAWSLMGLVWLLAGVVFRYQIIGGSDGNIRALLAELSALTMGLELILVPLLTMRLLAEERRSGTYEMLVTTPARDVEIVLAKWGATQIFLALVWLIIPLYAAVIMARGGEPDFGPVWASYFVVVTTGGLYAALGLLASSVSRQQIVAGLAGFAAIMAFFYVPALAEVLPTSWETLRDVLRLSDLSLHGLNATEGLLDLVHLSYRWAMTGFILLVAVRVVEMRKWS